MNSIITTSLTGYIWEVIFTLVYEYYLMVLVLSSKIMLPFATIGKKNVLFLEHARFCKIKKKYFLT
jgi:hypothetical protein